MFSRRPPLWLWWIPLVWILSAPSSLTSAPQWDRVGWRPFVNAADQPHDLLLNTILFVPFGYSIAGSEPRRRRVALAMAVAGLVSLSAESLQLFSTTRYPSATDIVAALAGALAGAVWVVVRKSDQGLKRSLPSGRPNGTHAEGEG
jgi:VanZ family protein